MRAGWRAIPPGRRRDLALWAGTFAAPVAWFVQHVAVYALTPRACSLKSRILLHLTSLTCLAVAGLGAWTAFTEWEAVGRGSAADLAQGGAMSRVRLQAVGGLLASGLFLLVIVAEWMAISVLDPCVP